jgi:hypothetical protein
MPNIAKPTTWTSRLLATLDLPQSATMQTFARQEDGALFATQAVTNGALEDLYVTKVVNGVPVGTMYAPGAGHGALVGLLGGDVLVIDYAGSLKSIQWTPGPITATSPGVSPFGGTFEAGTVEAVTDLAHGTVLFYDSTTKVGTLRNLADVLASPQVANPLGACTFGNKDAAGVVRLRQGWAAWDRQAFEYIGDSTATTGRELLSYDLATGAELWRMPYRFTTYAWEEPQGLGIVAPISGNPGILLGVTVRVPNTIPPDMFTRQHMVFLLRDPASRLPTDLGWHYVDPAKVAWTGKPLEGLNLWVERVDVRLGRSWAVTAAGIFYDLDYLTAGRAPV